MKTIRFLIFIGLIQCFFSCDNSKEDSNIVDITVKNNSDKNIDLLYFTTFENNSKSTDFSVDTSNQIQFDFKFSKNTKGDGTYSLYYSYFNSMDTLKYSVSYYTNGIPMESKLIINFLTDSIEVTRTYRDFGIY